MKRLTVLTVALIGLIWTGIGCATYPHVRPRYTGDIYISKVEPAPIVMATENGTPEAVLSPYYKLKGRIWNESGRCSGVWEFPANILEYRSEIAPLSECTSRELKIGQEVERVNTEGRTGIESIRYDLDQDGTPVCEVWKATNLVTVPPGLVSPLLRVPGGSYALSVTQTPTSGRYPYTNNYFLAAELGLETKYKGKEIDWGIVFYQCQARGF